MRKTLLALLALSSAAFCADEQSQFVTHTELGYIQTQGNTKTETFSLDAKAKKEWEKHLLTLTLGAQYSTEEQVETKNKYATELQYDYKISKTVQFGYLFGFKKDRFSGFDYQLYTGPTVKYVFIKSKPENMSLEAGVLYTQDNYQDIRYDALGNVIAYPNPTNIPTASTTYGKIDNYGSYHLKGVYDKQLSDTLKFAQELSYRASMKDERKYFAFSKTTFTSKLTDIFSAGIAYTVDYMNQPATSKEYSDRTFSATLIIDY